MTSFQKVNKLLGSRIFSGIQPTGIPHLGNYFGAISQWVRLSNDRQVLLKGKQVDIDVSIFSIVDVHAYTSSSASYGENFYHSILSTTASLLALGLNPEKCIFFRQSDIYEHNYLDNVLNNFVTTQRLTHMIQFKEKTKSFKIVKHGLLSYPILQAADILLYKSNLVPVGQDQVQHIELTRDIAKKFNDELNNEMFPLPDVLLVDSIHARRVKSLREPEKKMSKSDPNKKSFIEVVDEPDLVVEKCKKALTDPISEVYYDAENRPGVSNLIRIYHLTTGHAIDDIVKQFEGLETAKFKLALADVLIEKFKQTRDEFKRLRNDVGYLEEVLRRGESKAKPIAIETISQLKHLLGSRRLIT